MNSTIIRILSVFIPSSKKRKEFRKKYKKASVDETSVLHQALFNLVLSGVGKMIPDRNMDKIFNADRVLGTSLAQTCSNVKKFFKQFHTVDEDFSNHPLGDYAIIYGSNSHNYQPFLVSYALANNIPIVRVEDGFLRSADTWCNTSVNHRYTDGISFTFSNDVHYFDATRSSLMERLINDRNLVFSKQQLNRAKKCIEFIVDNYLTKYNHQPIYTPNIGRKGVKKILVVDQSYGDFSISKGLANDDTFKQMLQAAIDENPHADIIIKTHPDAMAKGSSRAKGYYQGYKEHDNIYTLTTPINPIALLKYCDKVYVCTTQFGFEALMCGKEVHTFGMPFYAGWGLTKDALICERRTNKRTLEEIFYIAYILYSHYINPNTGKPCEIEDAMNYLLDLRNEYFKLMEKE